MFSMEDDSGHLHFFAKDRDGFNVKVQLDAIAFNNE